VPKARPAPEEPVVSVYSGTNRDIAERRAAIARAAAAGQRRRDLIRRSDDLLERLETANLGHFGVLKNWSALEACRLTLDLVGAVNDLLLDVGLEARRLHNALEALEAVFEAQHIIFGHRHDSEEDNTDER